MALLTSGFSGEVVQDGKAQLYANYLQTEVPGSGEKFLRRAPLRADERLGEEEDNLFGRSLQTLN